MGGSRRNSAWDDPPCQGSGGSGTKREHQSLLAMRHIEGEFQCLGLLGAFP
jgi:hypothetical protein